MSVVAIPTRSKRVFAAMEQEIVYPSLSVSRDARAAFGLSLGLFMFMVWVVVFQLSLFPTDSMSRTLHAWQVFFSGDPKLTAIGFIWPPLPTLLQLPLVLLPPLRHLGLSGNVLTALMGAVTCVGMLNALQALGVGRAGRIVFTALFALNPMILYYAGNGLSEMTSTAFTLWSVAFFIRWNTTRHDFWLIMSAFSLSLATLARYDSLVHAALMVLLIPYVIGGRPHRPEEKQALVLAFITPVAATVLLWVLLNGLIMGDPLHFVRGSYSNAAQIDYQMVFLPHIAELAGNPVAIGAFLLKEVATLFPAFILALGLTVAVAVRARSRLGLALAVLVLSFPAFQALNFFAAQSAAFLRYFILAIPYGVLLLGYIVARDNRRRMVVAAAVLILGSNVATLHKMQEARDWGQWNDAFARALLTGTSTPTWVAEREIAAYLSERVSGRQVLVDDFQGYRVVFFTGHPEWFLTPGDNDFQAKLRQPLGQVRHMLASRPGLEGDLNQVNLVYPTLYESGAEWATLERDWGSVDPSGSSWRLYRVSEAP